MTLAEQRRAVGAAVAVGAAAGFASDGPIVLQATNNVVVWLAPHPIVAKVGVWPYSGEVLGREVAVCSQLAARGGPCAAPVGDLSVDPASGLPVSLWHRLEAVPGARPSAVELAALLHRVHDALVGCPAELPSYRLAIDLARDALCDDGRMTALPDDDLALLRSAFARWAAAVDDPPPPARPLHGEPHLGNVVVTEAGPHLIDFEAVSLGPVEWDLASMDPEVGRAFGAVDEPLLDRLRLLNCARVATWCWAGASSPVMRRHGAHHLEVIRRAIDR